MVWGGGGSPVLIADPFRCNSTIKLNPPTKHLYQCIFWTNHAILKSSSISDVLILCDIVFFSVSADSYLFTWWIREKFGGHHISLYVEKYEKANRDLTEEKAEGQTFCDLHTLLYSFYGFPGTK